MATATSRPPAPAVEVPALDAVAVDIADGGQGDGSTVLVGVGLNFTGQLILEGDGDGFGAGAGNLAAVLAVVAGGVAQLLAGSAAGAFMSFLAAGSAGGGRGDLLGKLHKSGGAGFAQQEAAGGNVGRTDHRFNLISGQTQNAQAVSDGYVGTGSAVQRLDQAAVHIELEDGVLGSGSLEGNCGNQQNGNQHQAEKLLHYCFHFVSNLLMKSFDF